MNKKYPKVKEASFIIQEHSGDIWYEEIYNWIFSSSFKNTVNELENKDINNEF